MGCIFSFLPLRGIATLCASIRNRIYTGFLRRRFASMGNSIIMWKPYNLLGEEFIQIGNGTIIEPGAQLTARKETNTEPSIIIGDNCLIRKDAHITAINKIIIGNNLLTGTNVLITDNAHGDTSTATLGIPPGERKIISKGEVKIGNNVWVGNNVCILPNVNIGDGVVIGANSIVTHDIPAYSVAMGIPAKVYKSVKSDRKEF